MVLVIAREGGGGLVAGKEEGATVSWHLEAQGTSPRSMRGRVARDGAVARSRAAVGVGVALEDTRGLAVGKPGIQRTEKVPADPLEGFLVRGPGGGSDGAPRSKRC